MAGLLNARTLQILAMVFLLIVSGGLAMDTRVGWRMRAAQALIALLAAGVLSWVVASGRKKRR